MSLKTTARAIPAILRIAFAEALAYRAEMLVWILSNTMPLVMLALWHTVAEEAPIGRFTAPDMTAYFLAAFIVRQLTSSWIVWQINMEVREGTLAMRMLRPIHPLVSYGATSLAELPVRSLLSVPAAAIALAYFAGDSLTRDPVMWLLWLLSIAGAWMISVLAQIAIGCLALFLESSAKVADVWLGLFFVFSGYTLPVELFPRGMRAVVEWLPFRYQLGLPVEIMTGAHDRMHALEMVGRSWAWVAVFFVLCTIAWKRGVRRFAAYGG
jgi:ABC-2 type transport system permease protein